MEVEVPCLVEYQDLYSVPFLKDFKDDDLTLDQSG